MVTPGAPSHRTAVPPGMEMSPPSSPPRPPMPWRVPAPWQNEELFWLEEGSCRGDLQVLAEVPAVLLLVFPWPAKFCCTWSRCDWPPWPHRLVSQRFLVCRLFVTCLLLHLRICVTGAALFRSRSPLLALAPWSRALPSAGALPPAVCPPWGAWEIASQNGSCPGPGKSWQGLPVSSPLLS